MRHDGRPRSTALAAAFLLSALATGCGGGGGSSAPAPSPAALRMTPATWDFGLLGAGSASAAHAFTVTNTGGTASGPVAVALGGDHPGSFSVVSDGCAGAPLAAGASCTVSARFSPAVAGALNAALGATASPGGVATASLVGAAAPPAVLTVTPTSWDFGAAAQGAASAAQVFTVHNDGGVSSGTISIALAGTAPASFAIGADGCTGSFLAAGGTCTVQLRLSPTGAGAQLATLRASAAPGGAATASVAGTGSRFSRVGMGAMTAARQQHSATLLLDGRVLLAGGVGLASAELYDPATRTFTATAGPMHVDRAQHTATRLADGTVLIAGGYGGAPAAVPLDGAEVFDPATGLFTQVAVPMRSRRAAHAAALLGSGAVVLIGGDAGLSAVTPSPTAAVELFDPATGPATATFTATGSLGTARVGHAATPLDLSTILVVGGFDGTNHLSSTERIDVGTLAATPGPDLSTARSFGLRTAPLAPGLALVAGGFNSTAGFLASAERHASGAFSAVGAMLEARRFHTLTTLESGRVLAAGGEGTANLLKSSADLFDPGAATWTGAGPMSAARVHHTATVLLDGSVLLAGGLSTAGVLSSAERFVE